MWFTLMQLGSFVKVPKVRTSTEVRMGKIGSL